MHLHRLAFEGIGPFASTFTVDFAALGQSGIFLLEGPTGAGKSTIIDAIVFALYGEPAGTGSSKERLHSHHAGPTVRPWVELIFETNAGTYRIHRTPAYSRPKLRGEGFTPQTASARLTRVTSPDDLDGGEVLSTSTQEVGSQIPSIIGLTREQFVQTVVLPQGEFAAFLRSTGEQRRDVLQSIFRTKQYDQITDRLIDLRRDAKGAIKDAWAAIDQAVAGFTAVASVDDQDVPDGLGERDDLTVLQKSCRLIVEQAESTSSGLQAERQVARDASEAATAALTAHKDLEDRLNRRAALVERGLICAKRTESMEAGRVRLALARQAIGVRTALRGVAEAKFALAGAYYDLVAAKAAFGADADNASVISLSDRAERITAERTSIAALMAVAATFDSTEKELARSDAEIATLAAEIGKLEDEIGTRIADREKLTTALATAQSAQADHRIADHTLEASRAVLTATRLVTVLAAKELDVRADLQARLDASSAAQVLVHALRQRKLAGMAGELALELSDGTPCAVCGSLKHPQAATPADDHPTDSDIETAEQNRVRLETGLNDTKAALAVLTGEREAAAREAADMTEAEAQHHVEAAQSRVEDAAEAARLLADLTVGLQHFDEIAKQDEAALQLHRVSLATTRADRRTKEAALCVDRDAVAAAHHGRPTSLTELDAELAGERARIDDLRVALGSHSSAVSSHDKREAESKAALSESGFVTADEASDAALDRDEITRLATKLADHDRDVAVVADGLAAAELAGLDGTESPDIAQAQEAEVAARDAYDVASRAAHIAAGRSQAARREFGTVEAAVSANEHIVTDSLPVIRMADVADASGPANLRKLTLGSYVLVRRFEDVVKAANMRLLPMSGGRYRLDRSDEGESKGGRKTGLSLRILDSSTGKTREPRTFSGGETFYASLCLALGLADVVMSEAGGTDLGTLFVDEGFGSLDSETLDAVMSELGRLSSGGRVVGIVSHVEDLKQRVSDRISVRRNDDGSSRLSVSSNND